jgi:hypothetical protein
MTISSTSEFTITNSYVVVHSFDLTTPDTLAASAVTVNGIAVTSITAGNGQYTADISGIMSRVFDTS